MKNVFLLPNASKEKYYPVIREIYGALCSLGLDCSLGETDSRRVSGGTALCRFAPGEADVFLSVGGDGAFLRAGQTAVSYRKPLVGVNTGRLGFLCALTPDTLGLIKEEDALIKREEPLLACRMNGREYLALNDIVTGKDYFGGTVETGYRIGNEPEHRFIGDGLILSTPLGATAYTRSAGGPLLKRNSGLFALTPICAHMGDAAPESYPDTETVTVTQLNPAYSASVYADGVCLGQLFEITATKAKETVILLEKL